MMPVEFSQIFERILPPDAEPSHRPLYAVLPVPGHSGYFVGKDRESLACLLVSTRDQAGRTPPPIRLESLDAQFDLRCQLTQESEVVREAVFAVVRCKDSDRGMTRYFLSVCETLLRVLGGQPRRSQIAIAVNRIADIFQRVRKPSTRPISGLFGELYLLLRSRNAVQALAAWHTTQNARFDFSDGDVRLDVKATGGRSRQHTFSYEQCSPPPGTVAVVASLFAEEAAGGSSLLSLVNQIEARVSSHSDLAFKLHETVAATLGANLSVGLARRFDVRLAESSLRFFNLRDVPAIRGLLPVGVSDVHFRSDLSALHPLSVEALIDRDPKFWDLLPA